MEKSRLILCLVIPALVMGVVTQKAGCLTADELALQVENKYRSFENLSMDFV